MNCGAIRFAKVNAVEKIDVHRVKRKYDLTLERLRNDTYICQENKSSILMYLNACSLGQK